MRKRYWSSIILSLAALILLSFNVYSQVIKKNSIPDPGANKFFNKSVEDTINPPFLKEDFLVNSLDSDYGSNQSSCSAAADGNGHCVFAWIDNRNSKNEIYAQFYDGNGNKIGANLKVNDGSLYGNNNPFVAANKNGNFIIAWMQNYQDIVAQRFNDTGQRIGDTIIVSTTYTYNTESPSVAISDDGSFMVVWGGISSVYARLVDSSGEAVGNAIIINEPDKNISNYSNGKYIAVDDNGDYCITWNSYSNVYLQIVNKSGQLTGFNTIVNNPNSWSNSQPEISSAGSDNFLIGWDLSCKSFQYKYRFCKRCN